MVCEIGTNAIACEPPRGVYKRIDSRDCPECQAAHGFVERWDGAWYGTTLYGSCGDTWQDGERRGRPFERGWREKAVTNFEAMWEHAAPEDLYETYVRADCDMATQDDARWEQACRDRDAVHEAILAFQSFRPERGAE